MNEDGLAMAALCAFLALSIAFILLSAGIT